MRRTRARHSPAPPSLALVLAACGGSDSDSDADSRTPRDRERRRTRRPQGRADLVGHLGPDQRGPGVPGADREVQRGVPERQDQLPVGPVRRGAEQVQDRGRGRAPVPRTSCAPRSPGCPSSPRWATCTPSTAPPLLEDDNFLETPLSSQRVRRQDLRRPAGHRLARPAVQQEALRQGRHHRGPDQTLGRGRARPPRRSRPRPASTACTSTPVATSCCRSSTARVATWSTPRRRRSSSTAPRPSPASRSRRTWSSPAPRSSRPPTTPTAP